MKLSLVLTSLLGALAIASPVALDKRAVDYNSVVADIGTVKADLITLDKALTSFQGGPLGLLDALKIMQDTTTVENALKKTISDTKASPKFGKKGSTKVAITLFNLEPTIFAVLKETIAKKPAFESAGLGLPLLTSQVLKSLKEQKALSDQLGAAIVAKLDKALQSAAPAVQKTIDEHFEKAIKAYS